MKQQNKIIIVGYIQGQLCVVLNLNYYKLILHVLN